MLLDEHSPPLSQDRHASKQVFGLKPVSDFELRRRRPYHHVFALLSVVFLLGLCVCGGILNRLRGGYKHIDPHHILGHDVLNRLVFAVPTGAVTALLSKNWGLGLWMAAATFGTLYIGWGSYFSIGENPSSWKARTGVYDWMLGRGQQDWDYTDRWLREVVGMSIRGLQWTVPSGIVLFYAGLGCEYMLSGIAMGLVYDAAGKINSTTKGFERGPPLGEMIWGCFLYLVLICSVCHHLYERVKQRLDRAPEDEEEYVWYDAESIQKREEAERINGEQKQQGKTTTESGSVNGTSSGSTLVSWAFIVFLITADIVFLVACIMYSQVTQSDMRNKRESEYGLLVGFGATMLPQLYFITIVLHRRCCHSHSHSYIHNHNRSSGVGDVDDDDDDDDDDFERFDPLLALGNGTPPSQRRHQRGQHQHQRQQQQQQQQQQGPQLHTTLLRLTTIGDPLNMLFTPPPLVCAVVSYVSSFLSIFLLVAVSVLALLCLFKFRFNQNCWMQNC